MKKIASFHFLFTDKIRKRKESYSTNIRKVVVALSFGSLYIALINLYHNNRGKPQFTQLYEFFYLSTFKIYKMKTN